MGCHTWFYRKLDRTQEQAKERCLNGLKKAKKEAEDELKASDGMYHEGDGWLSLIEKTIAHITVLERQIRMVENGFCKRAVWNYFQDEIEITEFVDGKGLFIEDTGFHDVFRIHNYPEDRLFSLEETLEFINNHKNECALTKSSINQLKEFWEKYPEGIIDFG